MFYKNLNIFFNTFFPHFIGNDRINKDFVFLTFYHSGKFAAEILKKIT